MCRLFGLHAGGHRVHATFWLLGAPDSLSEQGRRQPDGAGIGIFTSLGAPIISRQAESAWHGRTFELAARDFTSSTFLAHVRYSSGSKASVANTHPFEQDNRLFAHNGVCRGLDLLDERLQRLGAASLVRGQTDSERIFALITAETRRSHGDVTRGITAALGWIIDTLPLYSLNMVMTTPGRLWALRYPESNELYILERTAGDPAGQDQLDARSSRIRAHFPDLARYPSVVIASEVMDAEAGWRLMGPGEMVCIGPDLSVESSKPFPSSPAFPLALSDLGRHAVSQRPD
jgi:predicted glutamine amidotransferase